MLSNKGWNLLLGGLLGGSAMLLALALRLTLAAAHRGRRQPPTPPAQPTSDSLTATDRHEILALLHQWMRWAGEYSAVVSSHQTRLLSLAEELQRDSGAALSDQRLASLLDEIIQSNQQLQQRLETAETQLEHQSRQIQSYLTEARTDALTQLCNRRSFDHKLLELLTAYRHGGERFVLAMIDIDQFKNINDTFGHQAGDAVLQQVAERLKQRFANAHLIARYGGEEFALLLPGSDLEHAHEHCRMLCRALAAMQDCGGVTASIGVAQWRPGEEPGAALSRADAALYRAKLGGRNRVELAS